MTYAAPKLRAVPDLDSPAANGFSRAPKELQIQLEILRIAAAVAVVLLHVAASVLSDRSTTLVQWWAGNIYEVISRWCVPVFIMISGALLLDDHKPFAPGQFYRRRVARLLWPLIFWSVAYLVYRHVHDQASRTTLFVDTLHGEPYTHLWFLYMLIGLYAVTPLLRIVVANSDRATLTITAALIFLIASVDRTASATLTAFAAEENTHTFLVMWLPYTAYFLMGYILTRWPSRIGVANTLICVIVSCAVTALLTGYARFYLKWPDPYYIYDWFNPIIICMSVLVFACFTSIPLSCSPRTRVCIEYLASLSLGIYVVHPFWIITLHHFGLTGMRHPAILAIPLTAAAAFALSAITTAAIRATPILRRTV